MNTVTTAARTLQNMFFCQKKLPGKLGSTAKKKVKQFGKLFGVLKRFYKQFGKQFVKWPNCLLILANCLVLQTVLQIVCKLFAKTPNCL